MALGEIGDLFIFKSVILNGTGYGVVEFVPANSNWTIQSINVKVLTASGGSPTASSICHIYRDSIQPGNSPDTTSTGNGDTSTNIQYSIRDGQRFYVEWVGGDAGAVATATLTGVRTVYGAGFRATPVTGI